MALTKKDVVAIAEAIAGMRLLWRDDRAYVANVMADVLVALSPMVDRVAFVQDAQGGDPVNIGYLAAKSLGVPAPMPTRPSGVSRLGPNDREPDVRESDDRDEGAPDVVMTQSQSIEVD